MWLLSDYAFFRFWLCTLWNKGHSLIRKLVLTRWWNGPELLNRSWCPNSSCLANLIRVLWIFGEVSWTLWLSFPQERGCLGPSLRDFQVVFLSDSFWFFLLIILFQHEAGTLRLFLCHILLSSGSIYSHSVVSIFRISFYFCFYFISSVSCLSSLLSSFGCVWLDLEILIMVDQIKKLGNIALVFFIVQPVAVKRYRYADLALPSNQSHQQLPQLQR